jgi:transcriptional regulator with XRE-family HTH domain
MKVTLDIPGILKQERLKRGLLQKEVAAIAKTPLKRYGSYEEGRAAPSLQTLVNLAEGYGYDSLDKFLFGRKEINGRQNKLIDAYVSLPSEKRKIVDFILGIKSEL